MSTAGIFYAEHVSDRSHYAFGTFLTSFVFSAGGGWVALLGYFLLDSVGWRAFVLCTSMPLFVPPIIILHCCMHQQIGNENEVLLGRQRKSEQSKKSKEIIDVDNLKSRIAKVSLCVFINILQGYGSILLLPGLMREENEKRCIEENNKGSCNSVVDGYQFLILALVTGAGNLIGRGIGYLLIKRVRFRILQPSLASILSVGYLLLLFKNKNMVLVVCSMGLCKIVYSMMRCETSLISFDPEFFGTEAIGKASAIVLGCGMLGSAIGNGCAAFLNPDITVKITFALSLALIGVTWSITERNN